MNRLNLFSTIPKCFLQHYVPDKPWSLLSNIRAIINAYIDIHKDEYTECSSNVYVGKNTRIDQGVEIYGPALIGANCHIRHGAYLRENVIIGNDCIVGNSTEIKNSIFFNHVEVPHFNYVGDSILGDYAHLGAGVKISNFLLIKDKEKYIEHGEQIPVKTIKIRGPDSNHVDTGLIKLGALIGDYVEIGCNSVLNPGTVLESGLVVPPLSCIGGYFKSGYKFNKTVSYMEELK